LPQAGRRCAVSLPQPPRYAVILNAAKDLSSLFRSQVCGVGLQLSIPGTIPKMRGRGAACCDPACHDLSHIADSPLLSLLLCGKTFFSPLPSTLDH